MYTTLVRLGHPVQIAFRNATGKATLALCLLWQSIEQHDLYCSLNLKKLTQKKKCWAKNQRICQGTWEEAKVKDTPRILQIAKFFTARTRIFGALRCLPFVRINWLGRPLNNGEGFCKVSKPTERNGAYHLQFDPRNFRKITIPFDSKPKISDFLAK